jgi:hypothetical protein
MKKLEKKGRKLKKKRANKGKIEETRLIPSLLL